MIKKYFFYLALLFPWSVLLLVMPLTTYGMNGEQLKSHAISAKKDEAVIMPQIIFPRSEKPENIIEDAKKIFKIEVLPLPMKDDQEFSLIPEREEPPDFEG